MRETPWQVWFYLILTGMSDFRLSDLTTIRSWQRQHAADGGELFPTFASLEWFVRQNRDELVRSGALIPQRGSRGSLVTPKFDRVVLQLLCHRSAGQVLC
jgi:hypothetical protein